MRAGALHEQHCARMERMHATHGCSPEERKACREGGRTGQEGGRRHRMMMMVVLQPRSLSTQPARPGSTRGRSKGAYHVCVAPLCLFCRGCGRCALACMTVGRGRREGGEGRHYNTEARREDSP